MGDTKDLVERLQMRQLATLGLANVTPRRRDDAHLYGQAAAALTRLIAERDGLAKDLAAQIAGHQLTAKQSTDNLMRANTATAKLDEVETRARKYWQAFRDLRLDITGHGPMCRDCADENGRCPHSGQPCDPDEAVREQIAKWRAEHEAISSIAVGKMTASDAAYVARTALSLDSNKGDGV